MYLFNLKKNTIISINVERESKSGNTVETISGARLRTDTKNQKIFHSYDFALLARKRNLNEFDEEYDWLCKRLNIRSIGK